MGVTNKMAPFTVLGFFTPIAPINFHIHIYIFLLFSQYVTKQFTLIEKLIHYEHSCPLHMMLPYAWTGLLKHFTRGYLTKSDCATIFLVTREGDQVNSQPGCATVVTSCERCLSKRLKANFTVNR